MPVVLIRNEIEHVLFFCFHVGVWTLRWKVKGICPYAFLILRYGWKKKRLHLAWRLCDLRQLCWRIGDCCNTWYPLSVQTLGASSCPLVTLLWYPNNRGLPLSQNMESLSWTCTDCNVNKDRFRGHSSWLMSPGGKWYFFCSRWCRRGRSQEMSKTIGWRDQVSRL